MRTTRLMFGYLALVGIQVITICALFTLTLVVGKKRAIYRVCWMLQSLREWMSGEGRFRSAAKGKSIKGVEHRA